MSKTAQPDLLEATATKKQIEKVIFAPNQKLGEFVRMKMASLDKIWDSAPIITEYRGLYEHINGKELAFINLNISTARYAKVSHEIAFSLNRESLDEILDSDTWAMQLAMNIIGPRTYEINTTSYQQWHIENK